MEKFFIPIEAYGKDYRRKTWYIDLTNMSYSNLIKLRNELKGTHSVVCLDKFLNNIEGCFPQKYNDVKFKKREAKRKKILYKKSKKCERKNVYGKY